MLFFNLDDVPAERRLHRRRNRTDRQRERRGLERRHHLARAEEPELSALVLGRGVGRVLLGEIGEVAAGFQLALDHVGRLFVGDEDVARAHLRRLVERGVVLREVGGDVGVSDVHHRCDGLFDDQLLAQDLLHVSFGQALLLEDRIELPGRILAFDVRFFFIDVALRDRDLLILRVLVDQRLLNELGKNLFGRWARLETVIECGLGDVLIVDGGDVAAAAGAAGKRDADDRGRHGGCRSNELGHKSPRGLTQKCGALLLRTTLGASKRKRRGPPSACGKREAG